MRNLLAIWREHGLDVAAARGVGARDRARRPQRRRDVLVRGRRDDVGRAARSRRPRSGLLPGLAVASTPTASPSGARSTSTPCAAARCRPAGCRRRRRPASSAGAALERVVTAAPRRAGTRVDASTAVPLETQLLPARLAAAGRAASEDVRELRALRRARPPALARAARRRCSVASSERGAAAVAVLAEVDALPRAERERARAPPGSESDGPEQRGLDVRGHVVGPLERVRPAAKPSGTAASNHVSKSRAHVGRGVLVERQRRRRVAQEEVAAARPAARRSSGSCSTTSRVTRWKPRGRGLEGQLTLQPHRARIVPRAGRPPCRGRARPRPSQQRALAVALAPASRRRARRGATGRAGSSQRAQHRAAVARRARREVAVGPHEALGDRADARRGPRGPGRPWPAP